jgi:hypothetical protein
MNRPTAKGLDGDLISVSNSAVQAKFSNGTMFDDARAEPKEAVLF